MANGAGSSFVTGLITALSTALVTFLAAICTVPTDYVTGRFRRAINRADLREQPYANLTREISTYVFEAEVFQEFFEHNITNRETLKTEIGDYNKAITALRTDEYANRAMITRFWSRDMAARFNSLMVAVKKVDSLAHEVNGPVNAYIADTRTPPVLDTAKTAPAAKAMKPALDELRSATDTFLQSLADD